MKKTKMIRKNNTKKNNKLIDYVIIGNSAAGLAAAESIRELDKTGKITVLSEEEHLNYSKPMITYFLTGSVDLKRISFKDREFYRVNNIDIRINTRVKSVDTDKMSLTVEDGSRIGFRKLLIASGGKPIIPRIRAAGAGSGEAVSFNAVDSMNYKKIGGIFTLATLRDAIRIKDYLKKNSVKRISILGGGLIGLKAAEAFLDMGIDINIIELADRVLSATFDRQASGIIEEKVKSRGSKIYKNNTIKEVYITKGNISGYRLNDGRKMECRLLVIAVGVIPNTGFIYGGKVKINRGILVDDRMQTSVKNIYAAGDVAEGLDMLLKENKNIAIWPLAVMQGAVAGNNMAGGNKKYSGGFFMNSVEILQIPSISMGLTVIEDKREKDMEVLKDFNPVKHIYKKIVIRNSRIIGVILVGNIERAGIYAGLIRNEIDISSVRENISRENFGIIHLPADYKKHLVVGEGIEV
jgi:NAD(P)H-nitrite reductase large subunit